MASEQKLDELAADYVAGNLTEAEADEFALLMREHPELRAEVNQLEKTVRVVLDELPTLEPPPHLLARLLATTETPEVKPQRSPKNLGLGAIAAGATLLSIFLGWNNYRLQLANQTLQQELLAAMPAQQAQLILQQPATRFYDFAGTKSLAAAYGSMIVDTDGLKAAIAFQNLPTLGSDQTYALWVHYQGQYIPCGELQPDQNGTVFATLPMPPVYQSRPWVKEVVLTVESSKLPTQPTGPIVAQTL